MAVFFIATNDLEQLAEKLAESLEANHDIFSQPSIITQTAGMNQWLRQKIATQNGIAANLKFVRPTDFINEVFQLFYHETRPKIAKQNLDLLIYQIISEEEFRNEYPQVASYFKSKDVKKWELAAMLADLFDQYQIYRTDVLKNWTTAEQVEDKFRNFAWQFYIWKRLKAMLGDSFTDMSVLKNDIYTALEQPKNIEILKQHFPSVALFGVSIFTSFHMEIFHRLYQHVDFYFYISDPAPEFFWHYDQSQKKLLNKRPEDRGTEGNPLLTSWGSLIQSTAQILFQDEAVLNAQTDIEHRIPEGDTLLSKIQQDIFYNRTADLHFTKAQVEDNSLKVVSVYHIQSEVEALYNYLLQTFSEEKIPGLKENEVLVITPEIDKYAPYIKAVFDQAPFRFQYSISDESIFNTDSLAQAILPILELTPFDFNAQSVLEVLDARPIQQKFGIDDIDWLQRAIVQSGFRFGTENKLDNETYLFSWHTAMQKLIYSFCIDGEEILDLNGKKIITNNNVETSADLRQIAGLIAFGNKLIENFAEQKKKRNLQGWVDYIENLLNDFVEIPQSVVDENLNSFIRELASLAQIEGLEEDIEIPYQVFVQRFKNNLQLPTKKKNFLGNGITFCSPQPFRSIPFRVIAFLGLGFDNYPRRNQYVDFDLMRHRPRLGDRSVRENDRHLFLESILAAKDALYLSYLGRDIFSNTEKPPSVLLDELLDYIQSGTDIDVRKQLIEQRPLHSFSALYNKEGSKLMPNYFIKKEKEFPIRSLNKKDIPNTPSTLEYKVSELRDAVCNGLEFYCKRALNFYFPKKELDILTTESFMLDRLDEYILNRLFLTNDDQDFEQEVLKKTLQGKLPLKNLRKSILNKHMESVKPLFDYIKAEHSNLGVHPVDFSIETNGKNIRIHGEVKLLSNKGLVSYTTKKPFDKDLITHFINYIVYVVAEQKSIPSYFYRDGTRTIQTLAVDYARLHLIALLKYVEECTQAPRWVFVKNGNKESIEAVAKYSEYTSIMLKHFVNTTGVDDIEVYKEKIYKPAKRLVSEEK